MTNDAETKTRAEMQPADELSAADAEWLLALGKRVREIRERQRAYVGEPL